MVRVQTYEGQVDPTLNIDQATSIAGEQRKPILREDFAGQEWESARKFAENLTGFGDKLIAARDVTILTNATNDANDRYNKLHHDMQTPQFKESTKYTEYENYYDEQSQAIRDDIMSNLDASAKGTQAINALLGQLNVTNKAKARTLARNGEIDHIESFIGVNLTRLSNGAIQAENNFDSTVMPAALESARGYLAGLRKSGTITAVQEKAHWDNFVNTTQNGVWDVRIRMNPTSSKQLLGSSVPGLDEAKREKLLKQAEAREKMVDLAERSKKARIKKEAEEAEQKVIVAEQNEFLRRMYQPEGEGGPLTEDEVINSKLKPVGVGSKSAFLKALADPKSAAKTTNFALYNSELARAYSGTVTNPNEMLGHMGKEVQVEGGDNTNGISTKDIEHLMSVVEKSQKPDKDYRDKVVEDAIKAGQTYIKQGSVWFGFEGESITAAYEFEHALRQELAVKKAQGKDVVNMLTPGHNDYILDRVIADYYIDPSAQLRKTMGEKEQRKDWFGRGLDKVKDKFDLDTKEGQEKLKKELQKYDKFVTEDATGKLKGRIKGTSKWEYVGGK